MAIYPKMNLHPRGNMTSREAANVEAWTEQAAQALQSLSLSTPQVARGTSVSLAIPLDETTTTGANGEKIIASSTSDPAAAPRPSSSFRRREPIRRDSQKRREALLKGKEGSRRRQRWENDRLLSNPWAQPPLPSDWEIHPTHPVHNVPYYLAPLWDTHIANGGSAKKTSKKPEKVEDPTTKVPKEVRQKLKRAKAAKGLLQDLEEDVRQYLKRWNEKEMKKRRDGFGDIDSDEEEIVFIGRNGKMHDSPSRRRYHGDLSNEKLVFDGPADDHGASFGRWLVHSIGTYYGLRTWSVTVGEPARRKAYVGIDGLKHPQFGHSSPYGTLPCPLWGLV